MSKHRPVRRAAPLIPLALALAPLGCDTTTPPVDPGLSSAEQAVLSGSAVILVPLEEAHPVVLFLTRLTVGEDGETVTTTINLTVIPEGQLTQGEDPGAGRVGDYVIAPVPEGDYVLTGIVDVDENFNPFYNPPAPYSPDLNGGYVNLATGSPVFHLSAGQQATEINVYFTTPAATPTPTPGEATPAPTATPTLASGDASPTP